MGQKLHRRSENTNCSTAKNIESGLRTENIAQNPKIAISLVQKATLGQIQDGKAHVTRP